MQPLPTAILRHDHAPAPAPPTHHDWLITPPGPASLAQDRLTTFRVAAPPQDWPLLRRLILTPLSPHRTHYLRHQGPVLGNRGTVTRVAQGHAYALLWSDTRICLRLHTTGLDARVGLQKLSPDRWLAVID